MTIRIKNWKLAILALLFFCLFASLGYWQMQRSNEKKILLESFSLRTEHAPLTAATLTRDSDIRFYRARLEGSFDNGRSLLLDNKTFHGQVGYELYTPFHVKNENITILVDRGFIPLGESRDKLPAIHDIPGTVTIMGLVNKPPTYVALGQIKESALLTWPLRIQYVNLAEIALLIKHALFPYVLTLEPKDPAAYMLEWQIVTMGPEKHMGYAVQWFALAVTLLILFVGLNRR